MLSVASRGVLVAVLAGCGGDGATARHSEEPKPLDPVVGAPAACGFLEPPSGTVDVAELGDVFHTGLFSRVEAVLRDAPLSNFHEVAAEQGACRHLHFAPAFCDPPCTGSAVCTVDATCEAYPLTLGGGTLTVEGLATAVSIPPSTYSPGTYHGPGGLPMPLFDAGDPVLARFEGDAAPPITLETPGVAPMDQDLVNTGVEVRDGEDATFTWTPGPDPAACVQLVLYGMNAMHGAPVQDLIVCEGADTGSLVVAASLVEGLPYGATPEVTEGFDWPHSTLTRYTRARAATQAGPVELVVRSTAAFLLSHPAP